MKRVSQLYWTEERRAPLVALRRKGVRPQVIADRLGLTPGSVQHALTLVPQEERRAWPILVGGNPQVTENPEQREREKRVQRLRLAGLDYQQIADTIGCTKGVVAGILYRLREKAQAEAEDRRRAAKAMQAQEMPAIGCRWIAGDPRDAGWSFCAEPVIEGTAWCREHRARIYLRLPSRNIETNIDPRLRD